jgi:hypothetical protein
MRTAAILILTALAALAVSYGLWRELVLQP